jgi:hypothetical protein
MNGSGRSLARRIPEARFVSLRGDHEGALRDPSWHELIVDMAEEAVAAGALR